jgi:hypothetical protein
MKRRCPFSEEQLAALRDACRAEPRLAALYAFGMRRKLDCELAALFSEHLPWPERLELELVVAEALGLENTEMIDLRRMPLVFRFGVIDEGDPIYVGQPDRLAIFIEETLARYSSFYPLLEALYWKVETSPLSSDML